MNRTKFGLLGWIIALALVMTLSTARADVTGTLTVSDNFSVGTTYGGSFDPSFWTPNGGTQEALSYLYCLSIFNNIIPSESYNDTVATDDGKVDMSRKGAGNEFDYVGYTAPFTPQLAGEIAWLLDNYGIAGQNTTQVEAVQEAIWELIYGPNHKTPGDIYGNPSAAADALEQTYIANLDAALAGGGGVGDVDAFLWFSPGNIGSGRVYQPMIGKTVPEPTSILFLGVYLAAGLVGLGLRKRRIS